MQHDRDRDGVHWTVGEVFADPAFAALKTHDAAFAVVQLASRDVVWANVAAAHHWGAEDPEALRVVLFGSGSKGGWLDDIARGAVPGRPPRLARGGLAQGWRMRARTVLMQAWGRSDGALLMGFAVPESAKATAVGGDAWCRPGWRSMVATAEPEAEVEADPAPRGASDTPADDGGIDLARRSQLTVLRDRLNVALDGAAASRLVWRTDAADVVTQIDTDRFVRLGAPVLSGPGTMPDIVAGFDAEGAARLRKAMASRSTWSGVVVVLPAANAAATIPVTLSATPVFGANRAFSGFRGFCVVDLTRLALATPTQASAASATEPSRAAMAADPAPPAPPPLIPSSPPPATAAIPPIPPFSQANVVQLRAFQSFGPGRFGATAADLLPTLRPREPVVGPLLDPDGETVQVAANVDPSGHDGAHEGKGAADEAQRPTDAIPPAPPPSDDQAFLALGEALRARIAATPGGNYAAASENGADGKGADGNGEAAAAEATPAADESPPVRPAPEPGLAPEADGPPRPAPAALSMLLDRLPMALLVVADRTPVFANVAAAARLGYASPDELLQAGPSLVLPVLPARTSEAERAAAPSRAGDEPSSDEGAHPTPRDGHDHAVTAPPPTGRSLPLVWDGAPATLWIIDEPPAAAVLPPPPTAETAAETQGGAGVAAGVDDAARADDLLGRDDRAVALLDGEGRVRRLNASGDALFGQTATGGVLGQSFTAMLEPGSRAAALSLIDEVRSQRGGASAPPLNREVDALRRDGTRVPMILSLGRVGVAGFYATLREAPGPGRAEAAGRAGGNRDAMGDAGRLSSLLSKLSHEIRTPLGAILGFAEVMMDERFGPLGNARYKDYLKDIHASGTQLVAMVSDLLDLSRVETGGLELDVRPLDVNRIVTETVTQMQAEAHRSRVIMRTSLAGRLHPVLADERSARQIVRNLLSNAVKFNEPGGQVIVSTALDDGGNVLLRIRDTGVGMTEAEIATALEPFGVPASARPAGSNGLGLPLTRALIGVNRASLSIRSRPREGTLVEVAFTPASADALRQPA